MGVRSGGGWGGRVVDEEVRDWRPPSLPSSTKGCCGMMEVVVAVVVIEVVVVVDGGGVEHQLNLGS